MSKDNSRNLSMKIVLFTHPDFSAGMSMRRFAGMINAYFSNTGHDVQAWAPQSYFSRFLKGSRFSKWLGYIDQYLIFPFQVKVRLLNTPRDTLFVFCDQALGPWVPLVENRPNVIHVHDFTALRSALGHFPLNPVGRFGKIYQRWIKYGFSKGRNFISVSKNTKKDLEYFLGKTPPISEVVYNGVNSRFHQMRASDALSLLRTKIPGISSSDFLLHIGGNQWYKNRDGVIRSYGEYVRLCENPLPLYMIGESPTPGLINLSEKISPLGRVEFLTGFDDSMVCAMYSLAKLLVFPSHAEGFGWPILEAMACGCVVLTSDRSPMTEVGGDAAFYVPAPPISESDQEQWAVKVGIEIYRILKLPEAVVQLRVHDGIMHAKKFNDEMALENYRDIYEVVLNHEIN